MKCGPLKMVWRILAVLRLFVALSSSATMMGSGKPMTKPMMHSRKVFFIRGQNCTSVKKRVKFWKPTQRVYSPRIGSPGIKSWNAISTP